MAFRSSCSTWTPKTRRVDRSDGIVPTEVPSAVCRLFGFARVTDEMSAAVEPHRDALVREGYLELQGVNLVAISLARPSAEKTLGERRVSHLDLYGGMTYTAK